MVRIWRMQDRVNTRVSSLGPDVAQATFCSDILRLISQSTLSPLIKNVFIYISKKNICFRIDTD